MSTVYREPTVNLNGSPARAGTVVVFTLDDLVSELGFYLLKDNDGSPWRLA